MNPLTFSRTGRIYTAMLFILLVILAAGPVAAHGGDESSEPAPTPTAVADDHHDEETTDDHHDEETADDHHDEAAADDHHDGAGDDHHGGNTAGLLSAGVLIGFVGMGGGWMMMREQLSTLQYAVMGTGLVTGVIHLILGVNGDTLLLFNGLGYLILMGALFAPMETLIGQRPTLRWITAAYTVITLGGYFALHTPTQYDTLGLITKGIEVVLLILIGLRLVGIGDSSPEG